uniref:Uncharacterized protein n=1 Tax=Romanomermis culicivorax TaxID=13658 RepID=A0A915JMS0_ROMCU
MFICDTYISFKSCFIYIARQFHLHEQSLIFIRHNMSSFMSFYAACLLFYVKFMPEILSKM